MVPVSDLALDPLPGHEELEHAIATAYSISVRACSFHQTAGFASTGYVVDATGGRKYFGKMWHDPSVAMPGEARRIAVLRLKRALAERCPELHVPGPLLTRDGQLWTTCAGRPVALFPFVPGVGLPRDPTPAQRRALGQALAALHRSTPKLADVLPGRETFTLPFEPVLRAALAGHDAPTDVRSRIMPRRDDLLAAIERARALADEIRAEPNSFVLCHTDMSGDNVIVQPGGELSILDWDEALLAPAEADLWSLDEITLAAYLVPFQLDRCDSADPRERVRRVAELALAQPQEAVDTSTAHHVFAVVAAGDGRPVEHPEVRLDEIEPGGLGRREHEVDAQPPAQRQEARMVVDQAQVVQDHVQAAVRVAGPQASEGVFDLAHALALAEDPREHVGVHVVEAEEGLGAAVAVVRRTHPRRLPPARPAPSAYRPELERAPLVEADDRRSRRAGLVEGADAPPFGPKAGSSEVFQVRMRWAERPSRRSTRRTHSSLNSGMRWCALQYSVRVRTDQLVNGSPSSAGEDSAVSTSSRSCVAVMIGMRPRGLGTASKVRKPETLKRRTQLAAVSAVTPTRSAAARAERPARTSAITRYRWCTRADSERRRSFAVSTFRSARVRGRRKLAAMLFLLCSPDVQRVRAGAAEFKLERH